VRQKALGFGRFVLTHLDATLDVNDLKKISTDAKAQCSSELAAMCADLIRKADAPKQEDALLSIK